MSGARMMTIGSANIDLIAYAARLPGKGETFVGRRFEVRAGGKGANQAVRVALSGGYSYFVGRIGSDLFAPVMMDFFSRAGVDTTYLIHQEGSTGIGHTTVEESGDYAATIIPAANQCVVEGDVDRVRNVMRECDGLILQLEIPVKTVIHAVRTAKAVQLPVFLNAAPSNDLPKELGGLIDVMIVNEVEAQMITGRSISHIPDDAIKAAHVLQSYAPRVVVTLGKRGVAAVDSNNATAYVPGHNVQARSALGAGDAFIGELAVRLVEGESFLDVVKRANAVAALVISSDEGVMTVAKKSVVDGMA